MSSQDHSATQGTDATAITNLSDDIATLKDTVKELTETLNSVVQGTQPKQVKPLFPYSTPSYKMKPPKTAFEMTAEKRKKAMKRSEFFSDCPSSSGEESENSNTSDWGKVNEGKPAVKGVRLPPFTGKESWKIWYTRFSDVAARQGWSKENRLDELLPKLHGEAAEFVFDQLSRETRQNYKQLIAELNNRFRHVETTKAYAARFSNRRQKPGELPEDYAADLKKLYDKAHKNRDQVTRQEDLLRRYLDGLCEDQVRFHVEFIKEPDNIDDAVYQTVNFNETRGRHTGSEQPWSGKKHHVRETTVQQSDSADADKVAQVKDAPTKKPPPGRDKGKPPATRENKADSEVDVLRKKVAEQEAKITELCSLLPQPSTPSKAALPKYGCFRCGDKSHFIKDCPIKTQQSYQPRQFSSRRYVPANMSMAYPANVASPNTVPSMMMPNMYPQPAGSPQLMFRPPQPSLMPQGAAGMQESFLPQLNQAPSPKPAVSHPSQLPALQYNTEPKVVFQPRTETVPRVQEN
jgi:hypothetical protein